jgi:APA family basic amino acid/polyamine antiporter
MAKTVAALFVRRRKYPGRSDYQTPGYPLPPIIFLVGLAVLLVLLESNNPKQALLGLSVVALGIPGYFLLTRYGFLSRSTE